MKPKSKSSSKEKKSKVKKKTKSRSKDKKKGKRSKDKKKKKKKGKKKTKSPFSATTTTEEEKDDACEPLQKVQSSEFLKPAAIELATELEERLQEQLLEKRQFPKESQPAAEYQDSILQAAEGISHEFHEHFMPKLQESNMLGALSSCNNPDSVFDAVKKSFLAYLNSIGQYSQIRETVRDSVARIIQQSFGNVPPAGFNNPKMFQQYMHNIYILLTDVLQDTLKQAENCDGDRSKGDVVPVCRKENPDVEQRLTLLDLHFFSQEAVALNDVKNAQHLLLQRICQDTNNPTYWLDFAIFWAELGEDKMQEIALREVLQLDPDNVLGLIMLGVLAARNKDPRAIPLIGQAVVLRPLSPELLVILASAYKVLGKEKEAKYFFLKARCLHLHLTGGDPSKAELALKSISFVPLEVDSKGKKKKKHKKRDKKSKSKNKRGRSKGSRKSKSSGSSISSGGSKSNSEGRKSKKSEKGKSNKSTSTDSESGQDSKKKKKKRKKADAAEILKDKQTLFTAGKDLQSNKDDVPLHVSYYDVPIEFSDLRIPQPPLGPMKPYIRIPWDVTAPIVAEPEDLMATPPPTAESNAKYESKRSRYSSNFADHIYSAEVGNEDSLLDDLQRFADGEPKPTKSPKDKSKSKSPKSGKKKRKTRSKSRKSGRSKSRKSKKSKKSSKSSSKSKSSSSSKSKNSSNGRSKKGKTSSKNKKKSKSKSKSKSNEDKSAQSNNLTGSTIWDYRLGSEYMWAAQLLLKLHEYDFLDLALAKELHFTQNRSVPFMFILALSRHLRGQNDSALRLVDELLRGELCKNSYVLELKGHILHAKGELEEAIMYLENAIKIAEPGHNLQLAYLKLGLLYWESGDDAHARSMLLNSVSLFPTLYSWTALGDMCYKIGEYEHAEIAYSHANRLDSTNPDVWGMLSLLSLLQENPLLAEETYKWAVRYGLPPDGQLAASIRTIQKDKGYLELSLPTIPDCVPHEFYLQRLGKLMPIELNRKVTPVSPNSSCTELLKEERLRVKLLRRIMGDRNALIGEDEE